MARPRNESVDKLVGASTTSYSIEIAHSHNEGLVALPIAGVGPRVTSIVRLHAAQEFITVYWSAIREGAAPVLPSWKSFIDDPNVVFLDGQRSAIVPSSVVGGHAFVCAGSYRYSLLLPRGLDSDFALGVQPWEMTYVANNLLGAHFIPAENFIRGILSSLTVNPMPAIRSRIPFRSR
jgi:hypothetical protein